MLNVNRLLNSNDFQYHIKTDNLKYGDDFYSDLDMKTHLEATNYKLLYYFLNVKTKAYCVTHLLKHITTPGYRTQNNLVRIQIYFKEYD